MLLSVAHLLILTLDVPLESDPLLDALLDRLASLAENALHRLASGRDVLGQRVRRDDERDDALVIGRRVNRELMSVCVRLGSTDTMRAPGVVGGYAAPEFTQGRLQRDNALQDDVLLPRSRSRTSL